VLRAGSGGAAFLSLGIDRPLGCQPLHLLGTDSGGPDGGDLQALAVGIAQVQPVAERSGLPPAWPALGLLHKLEDG